MEELLQQLSDFMLTQALLWIFYCVIIILVGYGIYRMLRSILLHYEKTDQALALEGLEESDYARKQRLRLERKLNSERKQLESLELAQKKKKKTEKKG